MYVNLVPIDCRSRIISHIKRDDQLIRFISGAIPEFMDLNNRVEILNSMERSIDNNARNQEQYSTNGCQQHLEKK